MHFNGVLRILSVPGLIVLRLNTVINLTNHYLSLVVQNVDSTLH